MKIFGVFLPFVGVVLGPCDQHGVPAMGNEEAAVTAEYVADLIRALTSREE